jgi:hypothetical protein
MTKKLKATLSMFLCAVMVLCSVAVGGMFATADTNTSKAIQLVKDGAAANISGGQASNIYFGTCEQSSAGKVVVDEETYNIYNIDPIKWRVLENNTESKQLFLLSDQALTTAQYDCENKASTWATSTIRSWLNLGFINIFSIKEQTAIALTENVINDDNPKYRTEGGEKTNDKLFLLSIDEANNSSYFSSDDARKCDPTKRARDDYNTFLYGTDCYWWLRSPGYDSNHAAGVLDDGGIDFMGPNVDNYPYYVRPAFNLNLSSVLFTSAAVGGKKSTTGTLSKIADYTGNDWKVTLKDADREFKVTESNASGKPGDKITLSYSGATIYNKDSAPNEYISYIITDSNNDALYYGRVMQPTAENGQVSITIPTDLAEGKYTLNVFSEQYNGGANDDTKLTDYASEFSTIKLTVCDHKFDINGKCSKCLIQKIANPTANENLTYTGEVQTGVNAGTGYTLTNNTGTNAGSYTATATLSDGYIWSDESSLSRSISWSIAQKEITPTVNIEKDSYEYTKEQIKPIIKVYDDKKEISADEYDVTYSNNIELGIATVTVKSKETGNYKFSTTKNFTITKADPTYDKPSNLEGVYGLTLSTIDLPKGWSWVDGTVVMNTMGNQEYSAKYTPTDTEHYNVLTIDLPVNVKEHEHKWSSEWSHDETYHWHECTADGTCTITDNAKKDGYAAHNGGKATCTEDGFCADCKVKYLDATGHAYANPSFTWADDNTAKVTFTCSNDETHTLTKDCKITSETTKKATCTEKGEITYTASYILDNKEYTNVKKVPTDAIGHSFDANGKCTKAECGYVCDHAASTSKATCEKSVVCSICSATLSSTGHDFSGNPTVTKATFFKDGSKVYHCTHEGCTATRTEITLSTINRILAWFKNIFSFKF